MAGSWRDERVPANDDNSDEVNEIFYRDVALNWPGLPVEYSTTNASSSRHRGRHTTAHQNRNFDINGGMNHRRGSNFVAEVLRGGSTHGLDTAEIEQARQLRNVSLSAQLRQPHPGPQQTLLPVYQPPLPADPFRLPRYRQDHRQATPLVIPSTRTSLEFYQQKKEMIARHHWKLSVQDMTFPNAQRCIRMLMKHHWKILELLENLLRDGQTEPQLLDRLIRDHGNLLAISRFVLTYFETARMPYLRQ